MVNTHTKLTNFFNSEGVQTRSKASVALSEGRAFVCDTTTIDIADSARLLFVNESTDKVATIYQVVSDSSTSSTPVIMRNPTVNTPTTARPVMNLNQAYPPTSEMTLYADDGLAMEPGDGENTGIELTIPNTYNTQDYHTVIPPGQSMGITSAGSGLTSASVKMSLFYFEQDL